MIFFLQYYIKYKNTQYILLIFLYIYIYILIHHEKHVLQDVFFLRRLNNFHLYISLVYTERLVPVLNSYFQSNEFSHWLIS
jgi:hypothetical protein